MSSALDELREAEARVAELRKLAERELATKKSAAVRQILELMVASEVTLEDLDAALRKATAKYSDGIHTWSGKGKHPRWLADALRAGRKLEEFAVKPVPLQKALPLAA